MKAFIFVIVFMMLFSFVSSAEYQLKKASALQVGDVIVDSDGNEIVIEKIEGRGKVAEQFTYEKSESLMSVLWGTVKGDKLPDPVVSSGSSDLGLSLGETGVGEKISGELTMDVPLARVEKQKSFWQKLMFWGAGE